MSKRDKTIHRCITSRWLGTVGSHLAVWRVNAAALCIKIQELQQSACSVELHTGRSSTVKMITLRQRSMLLIKIIIIITALLIHAARVVVVVIDHYEVAHNHQHKPIWDTDLTKRSMQYVAAIPSCDNFGSRSFSCSAPAIWNQIPLEIRFSFIIYKPYQGPFKRNQKTVLLSLASRLGQPQPQPVHQIHQSSAR